MSSEKIMARLAEIKKISAENNKNFEILYNETERVHNVMSNTENLLSDLDYEFEKKTGLTSQDVTFLFLAIGLQIARQYLLTKFPIRLKDDEAASNTFGHETEHSNREHRYYEPSLEEIIKNPVPFDAIIGSDGVLAGGGKFGHRGKTLGHDPLLGLIFGTANIATATVTTTDYESFHVHTNESKKDFFDQNASTYMVVTKTTNKLLHEGQAGKRKVVAALGKEIIHLRSDVDSKASLPLPIITSIDPAWASKLAKFGLDVSNVATVGKQAGYAILINSMIELLHSMFFEGGTDLDRRIYHVRTLKIVNYSNVIECVKNLV